MSSAWDKGVALNSSNVLHIRLASRGLTDENMDDIAGHLDKILEPVKGKSVFANMIELSENQIGNKGLGALVTVLQRHEVQVKCLKLYKNQIGDEGAFQLSELVKNQVEPIEELHLSHNLLTGLSLVSLCLAFHRHKYQAYPFRGRSMQFIPCWLRMEKNSIANPTLCVELLKKEANVRICLAENRDICGPYRCRHEQIQPKAVPSVHLFSIRNSAIPQGRSGVDTESAIKDLIRKSATTASIDAAKAKVPAILNNSPDSGTNALGLPKPGTVTKSVNTAGYPKASSGSVWGNPLMSAFKSEPIPASSLSKSALDVEEVKVPPFPSTAVRTLPTTNNAADLENGRAGRDNNGKASSMASTTPVLNEVVLEFEQGAPSTNENAGAPSAMSNSAKGKIYVEQLVSRNEAFLCPLCHFIALDPLITACSHCVCQQCFQGHIVHTTEGKTSVTVVPCPHPGCDKKLSVHDVTTLESSGKESEAAVLTILRRLRSNQRARCIHHVDHFTESFGGCAKAVSDVVKCEYVGDMMSVLNHQEICPVQKYIDNLLRVSDLQTVVEMESEKCLDNSCGVYDLPKGVEMQSAAETSNKIKAVTMHQNQFSRHVLLEGSESADEPEQEQRPHEDSPTNNGEFTVHRCVFDFDAQGEDQLCIHVGDMIVIWDRSDSGWAAGQKFDPETNLPVGTPGWFPEDYTELAVAA